MRAYLVGLDWPSRIALVAVLLTHGAAIGWGLPSSDGWDNDGVAPRDFLPGLVSTFTPGQHYTYPPLQLLITAIVTAPVTLIAVLRAKSFAQADIVASFLDTRVMTSFSIVARLLGLLAAAGIVLAMGELAALIAGPRAKYARAFGIAIAGVEVSLTYYAQTTNLDAPYMLWASLALVLVAKAVLEDAPRKLRAAAVCAACAIATKDQAYALMLLSLPIVAGAWLWDARRRDAALAIRIVREAGIAAAIGVGTILLLDGALFNPTGFLARVRFLLGPASQDFAQYSKDFAGRADAFADSWLPFEQHYPLVFAPLFALGFVGALAKAQPDRPRARLVALIPVLGALSFTLAFNCWARRVEERFVMPQMLLVGVYGAVALAVAERWLAERARAARIVAAFVVAAAFAMALRVSLAVDAVMLRDPRYDVERYLETHVKEGDKIEVYGRNVYLPRFAPSMRVARVGTEPVLGRNPMPGIEELQTHYGLIEERKPRFIVFGGGFVWRYLIGEVSETHGRVQPSIHKENLTDHDARAFFHDLVDGKTQYEKVLSARYEPGFFPLVQMHGSLGGEVWVFERRLTPDH